MLYLNIPQKFNNLSSNFRGVILVQIDGEIFRSSTKL